ncbi:hypothetical protein [Dyadobacter sp. CY323]|uniref:hypothetical protein n=1 Tax=Dyadobacter sp. CY323 TaxID=2907302 RepID=UPI001F4693C5|nr:hypothetical protein [Dyadobacter sp. CY323]MCE6993038.1 hypothetical protein [Dyadobacter sp. CY323]
MENQANGKNELLIGNEPQLIEQYNIIRNFFATDSGSEIIGSLNALMESVLFDENMEAVTPKMRIDIVNQLRVITLLSQLERNYQAIGYRI